MPNNISIPHKRDIPSLSLGQILLGNDEIIVIFNDADYSQERGNCPNLSQNEDESRSIQLLRAPMGLNRAPISTILSPDERMERHPAKDALELAYQYTRRGANLYPGIIPHEGVANEQLVGNIRRLPMRTGLGGNIPRD